MEILDVIVKGIISGLIALTFFTQLWPTLTNAVAGSPNEGLTLIVLGLIPVAIAYVIFKPLLKKEQPQM